MFESKGCLLSQKSNEFFDRGSSDKQTENGKKDHNLPALSAVSILLHLVDSSLVLSRDPMFLPLQHNNHGVLSSRAALFGLK